MLQMLLHFIPKRFNANELRRWSNDDGSIHVAEMMIENALFHLHEETARKKN
jgi:PhnB protein